jgi:hypothetical protein
MDFSKLQSHLSNLDKLEFRTPARPFVPLLFLTQIAGARLRTGQHDLAVTCLYARSYAVSVLVIRVGRSLQTVVKMFTDALRTSACCMSCWRGDQRSGQYDHPKHKWHLALRYRHFSLPILLRFPLQPRRFEYDAFEPELAGVAENGRAVFLDVVIGGYAAT